MNYAKGGPRILLVCTVLIWLICGGITLAAAFVDPAPTTIPVSESTWQGLVLGVGGASLGAAYLFSQLMKPNKQGSRPGGGEFALSLWGMVATLLGWFSSMYCLFATARGWEPPLGIMYSTPFGSFMTTLLIVGVVWLIPMGLFLLVAWIWDGFASDKGGAA